MNYLTGNRAGPPVRRGLLAWPMLGPFHQHTMINYRRLSAVVASGLFATIAAAQTTSTTPAPAPAPATDNSVTTMQKFEVSDVPIDQQILPTARPFNSVFGFDDNILDVPRNVTIVSRQQMDDINITDVTQFSKLTSSSFTDSDFGSPANPTIRGQQADYMANGMRQHIGDNGDGMPVDFNSLESVNIVPGPATVVQGASPYVGGYVDVITKRPFFDGTHGFISGTTGSYGTDRWTVDVGGPISPKLAYRFSYSGEDDTDSFWYDRIFETTALYGALDFRPSENYDILMTGNVFVADYRENFGINRPTQALISKGLYQTGTNINNGTAATASDPENTANVTGSDTIAFGSVIPIDYRVSANGPLSHAHGQEYNAQAIQTLTISPALRIVNNTVFAYTKRDTFNGDGYSEIDDPTVFADNRTEFIYTGGANELNAGLEEHWQHVIDYTNFYFEYVNVWDLSTATKRNDINFQAAKAFISSIGFFQPVPGWPGRYANAAIVNNDTNNSELENVSPYIEDEWKMNDQWRLVVGARMDFFHAEVKDPLTPNTEASLGFGEPNANISLVYKLTPTVSTYGTFNFSENYTGDLVDGGGLAIGTDPNTGKPTLPRSLFSEQSRLWEYGVKASIANGKLFITTDVFDQTRQNKPQGGSVIQYQYYGFEFSANYQPNKNFYATVGYSWINGSLTTSPSNYIFQAYDTNQIPGGPPNPFANPQDYPYTHNLRAPGQPLDLINALGQYTFNNGFGFEVNALVTSPMNNDYWGYLVIPWQYEIDAGVFYKLDKHWELRASGSNLTNQHNWQPNAGVYGLEGIMSQPTAQASFTVKYKL
jgi:catecholate siderophore receptor